MEQFDRIEALRERLARFRRDGESVGLVPTMGYLHDGHLALVDAAARRCDRVVVSIFVNPTQFGPNEDLAAYPRDLERDLTLLAARTVDCVFTPGVSEIYPRALETSVEVHPLGDMLIGTQRPGHFTGVATVVTKLFNIVQPDAAFFGEKDYQQLAVIRRMVSDLDMPVEIVPVPTVREKDGLALSSRNVRLSPEDRAAATVLSRALGEGARRVEAGEGDVPAIVEAMRAVIAGEPRADLRSLDIRDAETLAEVEGATGRPVVLLVTARFGDVLLIDQRVALRGAGEMP